MSHPASQRTRTGSWYLDPLVAEQKRNQHLALLRDWGRGTVILKTDLFEEANGADELLSAFPPQALTIGMDLQAATVVRARERGVRDGRFLITDARRIGLASDSVDLVLSNSTLDHFDVAGDLEIAVRELARILRPGGRLIITLDNPRNPMYHALRWTSRRKAAPFRLGHTLSLSQLVALLQNIGLDVISTRPLIHNPRLLSTIVFLAMRRTMGRTADGPIRLLLRLFESVGSLPTREFTACFIAVCGQKPANV